ncbi:MAG: CoA transferase [Proteobacteria bacterium]|nr:CoA transferase [Pseudomonadota bacterium]
MKPAYPLEDVRVLDFSRVLAGPFAGRMLSDLGAEVVKVEPPEGDITRGWGRMRAGLSGYYTQQNAGKESVCVDLEAPGSTQLLRRLAGVADVVIENFRPGVMARHGLGWKDLSADNPRLIMLSISGFGQDGPESYRAAYAAVLHAESGLVARQAEQDGRPASDPVLSIADMNAGLHGLVAILSALHLRERTGRGQHLDIAMLDTMLVTDDYANFAVDGIPLIRGGGEVWEASGGPIMITGDFRMIWKLLVKHHGLVDPTPEGADLATKIRLRREAVSAFYQSFPDRPALIAALDAMNLAWGDVRPNTAAFASPTARSRRTVAQVDDRQRGSRPVVQSPYRFSDAESGVREGPAYRGEHNRAVLARWLDAGAEEIEQWERTGVLDAEERP